MQIKNIRVYKIEFCIIIKMVLDYIPCNTDCLGDLLKVCWNVTELKRDDQWDMFQGDAQSANSSTGHHR